MKRVAVLSLAALVGALVVATPSARIQATPSFGAPVDLSVGPSPRDVELADLNHDGIADEGRVLQERSRREFEVPPGLRSASPQEASACGLTTDAVSCLAPHDCARGKGAQ